MPRPIPTQYRELQIKVEECALSYGLNMFPCSYELLDFDEINMIAAYGGFPVRYPHWRFGMEYTRLSKSFTYGMHRIYEMVINNDPCFAYLLESNSFLDQKLVMCHVSGHNDFFKNNFAFSSTNRKMIDEMANHASRIRRYIDWYGVEEVESFIDACLSIDNLIDFYWPYQREREDEFFNDSRNKNSNLDFSAVNNSFINNKEEFEAFFQNKNINKNIRIEQKAIEKIPKNPTRDIMGFLLNHAQLTSWQRDVLDMLRKEAYYFAPQAMTKIMNEGWASYWHSKLMNEKIMNDSEIVDFADRHSGVMQMSRQQLNPYKLGLEIFRDIEERYNKGQFGKEWEECSSRQEKDLWNKHTNLGKEKIFETRSIYTDLTFIDAFLTEDFCAKNGFFASAYDQKTKKYIIESRDFTKIKNNLLMQLTRSGHPHIEIVDSDFDRKGTLYLRHKHEGIDLDKKYGQDTLKNIYTIFKHPLILETIVEEKKVLVNFNGQDFSEQLL